MVDTPPSATGPRSPDGTPEPGAILAGKYQVLRRLGEGGMGVVLEAENTLSGKRVAIKWMRPQFANRPEAAERLMREARASSRVRHPNVVDVYDVVRDGDALFLVMELLEGEPLSAALERGGMPAHQLIALLLAAMRGVAAAHKHGVIHRDIKPDNIFLAVEADQSERIPKVLDFGISKLSDGSSLSLTQTGTTLGTPLYMSFEQLCGVKDIDARTDVYAFGVILYEALTGRPPFVAETFPELIVKITTTRPAPPKVVRSDIPRSLDRLIQQAMAKERAERIASLDELIAGLQRFATPELFRAEMTADGPMPRVVSSLRPDELRDPSQPVLLVREQSGSGPVDTPLNASVPIPAIPRRREFVPWLVGGGLAAALVGGLFLMASGPAADSGEPHLVQPATLNAPEESAAAIDPLPQVQAGAAGSVAADGTRPSADPSSATPGASASSAPPVRRDPPKPAVQPMARSAPSSPSVTAPPREPIAPVRQPVGATAPPSSAATQPPSAATAPASSAKAKPTEASPTFRAGRVRSQDF